ncbi:cytochrome c oxidase subunit 3 family protein [Prosthecobacter sp.]|uniref:cytochrome c oxidase subunit 3 family protein n=1 Tax=Prosthecobacter sp. TaxID=1965333 RepID=UPI0037848016
MPEPAPALVAPQFESATQQRQASLLGMWIFLSTETLLFGGALLGYAVYRMQHAEAFAAAGRHTLLLAGTCNTAILLLSSYLVARAVQRMEDEEGRGARAAVPRLLTFAVALGTLFLVIKGFEYAHEIREGLFPGAAFHIEGRDPQAQQMFFILYFTLTALHAVHVTIGMLLLAFCAWKVHRSSAPQRLATLVDLTGLYWHFVDLVWVFLFPLFYLLGRSP